jgi:hypothetical protein
MVALSEVFPATELAPFLVIAHKRLKVLALIGWCAPHWPKRGKSSSFVV